MMKSRLNTNVTRSQESQQHIYYILLILLNLFLIIIIDTFQDCLKAGTFFAGHTGLNTTILVILKTL